jgi:hypothetical protein
MHGYDLLIEKSKNFELERSDWSDFSIKTILTKLPACTEKKLAKNNNLERVFYQKTTTVNWRQITTSITPLYFNFKIETNSLFL